MSDYIPNGISILLDAAARRNQIRVGSRRLVIKLGTAVVADSSGAWAAERMGQIIRHISEARKRGDEIILVSSGAVGLGKSKLGLSGPISIEQKQAAAAVGQSLLMNRYIQEFANYGITVGQVLLTSRDLSRRDSYLNVRATFTELLKKQVIPIVNENDTVSISELKGETFGDNDRLSSLVAGKLDVTDLVLLTNVNGIYDKNPKLDGAQLIRKIEKFTDLQNISTEGDSGVGRGGMVTKLQAARTASLFGVRTWVANGHVPDVLRGILNNEEVEATQVSTQSDLSSRKRWIGFSSGVVGEIVVNLGAAAALKKRSSLLAKGILSVNGTFGIDQVVRVVDEAGNEIGRGVVNFTNVEVGKILGYHSSEIEKVLSRKAPSEVIHRDKLVVYEEERSE
ncbi:MAG: glutamate 5-kinase [Bdellovibrionales bacterium]|nr:glutamate 5-kinase [Bdellovibrionales bacterium]